MFVTKKSALPRRTFLLGIGTRDGAAVSRVDGPRRSTALAQTPAKPPLRFGAVYFPNGATMPHWMPKAAEAGLELTPILTPLEKFRSRMNVVRQPVARRRQDGHGSRGQLRRLAERRRGQADRGRGHPARHHDRSGAGEADRPGHAVPVARVRHRGLLRLHRRLRPGLQLHLHEHHLVGRRDSAAADGDQPARGVRADVRPRRHRRAAAGAACARTAASSTRSPRRRAELQRRVRRRTARGSATTSTTCGRSSAAFSGPKRRTRASVTAVDAPLGVPETFEEHAALMFDLLAVAYQADLTRVFTFMMAREASQRTYPGARHRAAAPRRLASRRPGRARWSSTRRSTRTTRSCSPPSSRGWPFARRRRHRCSITR